MAYYGHTDNPYDEQRESSDYACPDCGEKWEDIIGAEVKRCEVIAPAECGVNSCEKCLTHCTECGIRVCSGHRRMVGKPGELKPYCLECAAEKREAA